MKGGLHPSSLVVNSTSIHKVLLQKSSKGSWETGTVGEALYLLEEGHPASVDELISILQRCRKEENPQNGLRLHAYLRKHGLEAHHSLGNYLVPMLVDVGRIQDAQAVFDLLPYQNEYSWNSLLMGYVKKGNSEHALTLHQKMQDDSVHPSRHAFIALLNACANLKHAEKGRDLHAEITRKGLGKNFVIGSSLVNMYTKCGLLALAQEVFDELEDRDVITWTSLITGYVKLGYGQQALACFDQMELEDLLPNPLTFVSSLKACGSLGLFEKGQVIYAEIARRELIEKDIFVGNAVIDMYAKCGLVVKAQEVFDTLPIHDAVSWNTLMTGFANMGNAEQAFKCFKQMQAEEVSPDAVTLVCSLKACSGAGDMDKGRQVHAEIVKRGFTKGAPLIDNALVDMYASCGLLAEAQQIFECLESQDAVVWTALIEGYTKHGYGVEALDRFLQMQHKGISPDVVTYICVLKSCNSISAIHKGQEIHAEIERLQLLDKYSLIGTSLVDLYASCGLLEASQEIFDRLPTTEITTWNALITGYVTYGYDNYALKYFAQMQLDDVCPDAYTFICILKVCGNIKDLDKGHEVHNAILCQEMLVERRCDIGTALVDMYFSCGSPTEAQKVFDKLLVQDLAPWNAIISGYLNQAMHHEALNCIEKMKHGDTQPDSCTYASGLKACSSLRLEDKCHELHSEIIRKGLLQNNHIAEVSPSQTMVLWNALATAYLNLEYGEEALNCLEIMTQNSISLDAVSYVCRLKACGILGALDKGQQVHADIIKVGQWEDDLMVSTALVDMYASCCELGESQHVFNKLLVHDVVAWNALMSGHVKHGGDKLALDCLQRMQLEGLLPSAVTYICSLNACGNSGALNRGQIIHVHVSEEILERDRIGYTLVSMYAKCGPLTKALDAFDKVSIRDLSSWNALIAECSRQDSGEEVLTFYAQMQQEGVIPDIVSFVCSIKACGSIGALAKGREMHTAIVKRGLLRKDFPIGNALVDMYAKCGSLVEAKNVFDSLPVRDTVSWNTLIIGNVNAECGEGALCLLKQMQLQCIPLDAVSYICSLKACGIMRASEDGKGLHAEISKKNLLKWNLVIGNALIDMYVGCGQLAEAEQVLKQLPFRDVVSWTTVIAGLLRHGLDEEALACLQEMEQEGVPSDVLMWNALIAGYCHLGQAEKVCYIFERMIAVVKPDEDTFLSILAACSHTGLVDEGCGHCIIMNEVYGITLTLQHFTCVMDLFGRAGQLVAASFMVNKMPVQPDIVAWHTFLAACQKCGNADLGIEAFQSAMMLDEKDAATFVGMFNVYAGAHNQEVDIGV